MNKKFIAFGFACLFAVSMAAPVGAVTDAEFQTLVNQFDLLTAQYNGLLTQTSVQTDMTGLCLTSNLSLGMTNDEVQALQQGLNQDTATQVAFSGAGSPGFETAYFGPLTKAAVIKFQNKYASEVLASWGLTRGTGYAGQTTMAKFNALYCTPSPVVIIVPVATYPAGCTSAVGFSTTTGDSCATVVPVATYPAGCTSAAGYSPTTGDPCSAIVTYPAGCTSAVGYSPTTGDPCSGTTTPIVDGPTEGSMTISSAPIAMVSQLYGGDMGKVVFAFNVRANGSDLTVKKVDINVTSSVVSFPWRTYTNFYLYDGTTLLATVPATQAALTETIFGNTYMVRFDGLNTVVAKDAYKTLTVLTDVQANPLDATGTRTIGLSSSNAVRAIDSLGLNQYSANTIVGNVITAISASNAASLVISLNPSSPVANYVQIDATDVTENIPVLSFNVKATGNSVIIKSLNVSATGEMSAVSLYDGATWLSTKAYSSPVVFDNLNIAIAKDATKTLNVKVNIAGNATGTVDVAAINGTGISAIDSTYAPVTASSITGAAQGYTQTAMVTGPMFSLVGTPTISITPSVSGVSGYAAGTITFSVTAFGASIPKYTNTTPTKVDMYWVNGTDNTSGTTSALVTVSPDQAISDGSTATVTVQGTAPVATTGVGYVSFRINSIQTDGVVSDPWSSTNFLGNFKTPSAYLQ